MEATAETLVNQVANIVLSKIEKQNIDPKFLKKFMDNILAKINLPNTAKIASNTDTDNKQKPTKGVVDDIKKAYKQLLEDKSYKTSYKKFLLDVLPKDILKEKDKLKAQTNVSNNETNVNNNETNVNNNETNVSNNETNVNNNETSLSTITQSNKINTTTNDNNIEGGREKKIKDALKPQKVIFDGFTTQGWAFFSEKLPKILKPFFSKTITPEKTDKKGLGVLGLLGSGLALLLGGLAALVTGLMTDGPFKGLLKLLSKAGLAGGLKLLELGAKMFLKNIKAFISAPINLLQSVARSIGSIFGPKAFKQVLTGIKAAKGLLGSMVKGLLRIVTPLLKRLPLIGTIISWGFAYTRFKSGDVIGGIIDVLSGVATLFPGIGTVIGIGLDVLNAFLDVKAGGASEKASQKKGNILKEWALGLGNTLYKLVKYIPIIGPFIQAVEDMQSGKWLDATYNLVRAIPGLGIVMDVLNWFNSGQTEKEVKGDIVSVGSAIGDWLNWLKDNIWEKITGFVTGVFDTAKDWWNNLSWDPSTWFGGYPEEPETDKSANTTPKKTQKRSKNNTVESINSTPIPMAEGGIVNEPINAIVGEAGPEAVVPLEKYFNPQDLTLNNKTLQQIANNTNDTNNSLKTLSNAIIKLVTVFDQKISNITPQTIINGAGGQTKDSTPASLVAANNDDPIRRVRTQFAY